MHIDILKIVLYNQYQKRKCEVLKKMIYDNNVLDIMKKIEHIKIDNNITNNDIARSTGKSKQTISNLLNGQSKNITLDTLKNLVNAVGYDLIIDFKKK